MTRAAFKIKQNDNRVRSAQVLTNVEAFLKYTEAYISYTTTMVGIGPNVSFLDAHKDGET